MKTGDLAPLKLRLIQYFLRHEHAEWNGSPYDLQLINSLKQGADPHSSDVQARLEERIRELYFEWTQTHPALLSDSDYKNRVLGDREYFETLFPL